MSRVAGVALAAMGLVTAASCGSRSSLDGDVVDASVVGGNGDGGFAAGGGGSPPPHDNSSPVQHVTANAVVIVLMATLPFPNRNSSMQDIPHGRTVWPAIPACRPLSRVRQAARGPRGADFCELQHYNSGP